MDGLNETLDKLFGENNKVLSLMLILYSDPTSIDDPSISSKLTKDFIEWILGLSLRNGWELTRIFRLQNEHIDWDSITHRVFFDEEIFLEITLERIDGHKFVIESNRSSIIALVAGLSNKLNYFSDTELDESELRFINDTVTKLTKLLEKSNKSPNED